jgi:beta-phosphoglucomutase-like phosphatase (HAD superfamily)
MAATTLAPLPTVRALANRLMPVYGQMDTARSTAMAERALQQLEKTRDRAALAAVMLDTYGQGSQRRADRIAQEILAAVNDPEPSYADWREEAQRQALWREKAETKLEEAAALPDAGTLAEQLRNHGLGGLSSEDIANLVHDIAAGKRFAADRD